MNKLPINIDLNTINILKQLNNSNNKIGELKGMVSLLPNPNLVLNLISISESKDSSAIENIITTYDEIYKELISNDNIGSKSKEVLNYKKAIEHGTLLVNNNGFISTNTIINVQKIIEPTKEGIRKLPGTVILNDITGKVVHIPPQKENEIRDMMANLESYINENDDYDPLIQMALIHYQFESIHPFYDGNGRTGRILNILYLVLKEKINEPILYLSKYIVENKETYYKLLRLCNEDIKYINDFVLYMLKGVEETSIYTINLINRINEKIELTKKLMQKTLPTIYKYEIVEHIFSHMYTKNEFFRKSLDISRATATKYLKLLVEEGFLITERVGKEVIYKNVQLFNLIKE